MATSTATGFPYPINSDPVNVPGDVQALAEASDLGYVLTLMGVL